MAEKILVISTFPPKGSLYNHPSSAVAGYSKNTLNYANQKKDFSFVILADILEKFENYTEDGQEIIRCWRRNTFGVFPALIKQIIKHKEVKKIFIAFEWAMFGSKKWLLAFVPFFLLVLRILNKKIYFISHGVLLDAGLVSIQMGVKKDSLKAKIWSFGLKILYLFIIFLSYKIVVFEEYLKQELLKLQPGSKKIYTIAHGVAVDENNLETKIIKKNPSNFLIQSFGFLIWYKGSDWLVEKMADFFNDNPSSTINLIMVGGATKTYTDQNYLNFIDKIYKTAKNSKGKIQVTGFVKEEEIAEYFQSADLLILPYRVLVSASGPLSLVFTYKKPFLISENLKGYCLSDDFSEALVQAGLRIEDLVFPMEGNDLTKKIETLTMNKEMLEKIQKFSELMYEKRKWPVIGKKYANLLNS